MHMDIRKHLHRAHLYVHQLPIIRGVCALFDILLACCKSPLFPNYNSDCSAVNDNTVIGVLLCLIPQQPKPFLLAPTNEPPSITAATSRQSAAPHPPSSTSKLAQQRQRRQLKPSGSARHTITWQSGDWKQWSNGDLDSDSHSLLSEDSEEPPEAGSATDLGADGDIGRSNGNGDGNAGGVFSGDVGATSGSVTAGNDQRNQGHLEKMEVVNAGRGIAPDYSVASTTPENPNLDAAFGATQDMAVGTVEGSRLVLPHSPPTTITSSLTPGTPLPFKHDNSWPPTASVPRVKKVEANDIFEPPSLTGATSSSTGSSIYNSNEPPSLTGRQAAPAFEPPSPALAAALRANELRRRQKYGNSAFGGSSSDSNQGVLFSSQSNRQQSQQQQQQQQ